MVVGVGIGGTFDKCALLAKKALMRPIDSENPDPFYADLEKEMLEKVNKLGIGPQASAEKPQHRLNIETMRLISRECRVQSTSTAMLPVTKRR